MTDAATRLPNATLRRTRRALWALVTVSAVALAACVVLMPSAVGAAALSLAGASLMLVVTGVGRAKDRVVERAVRQDLSADSAARSAGARLAVRIAVAVALAAFATTAVLLEHGMLAAGAAFTLTIFAVFGAPVWLAAVGEAEAQTRGAVDERRDAGR